MADPNIVEVERETHLEWTNRNEAFAHFIADMYAQKDHFDLIIQLHGGEQLMAHRHVLAIVSPVIMRMLESQLDENKNFDTKESESMFSIHMHTN